MIVAITGANGFIGQHLVRRFTDAGWTVRPVVRRDFASGAIDTLLAGADAVVHAAGATRAPTARALRESNVALTERVASAVKAGGVRKLIFVSSQAAAGPAASLDEPLADDMACAPVEAYGRSKVDAESVVAASGIPAVVVRPSAVYGPGDRDFLALFWLAKRGVAIHPGNREHWISIVHVDDLADVVLHAASADRTGTYFVANDRPAQWSELFQLGAECAGVELHMDANLPKIVASAGALVGDLAAKLTGHASLMTSGKAALSRERFWVCSNARAKRELAFHPRVSLRSGMQATYDWYVSRGWL
ncbi:MAG TPA: NAD-dependent epimerase/dehydratase family protein [Gemmatimonadaceae bacterium]|jgi:nucleoside-diphosphate-sugar epimerase|nr:NAD-dependent epimerase/dehydratase family protein [Gemmatimonadaceae bacterium]